MNLKNNWTEFCPFPSPMLREYLHAPFGAGVYELKNVKTKELVYVGESKNVACRMSSLLPLSLGASGRINLPVRNYAKYKTKRLPKLHTYFAYALSKTIDRS